MSLTAPERETVIVFSDADDTATVHTHQRRIITKLKNNPAAKLVEDISFDGTAGAVFEPVTFGFVDPARCSVGSSGLRIRLYAGAVARWVRLDYVRAVARCCPRRSSSPRLRDE